MLNKIYECNRHEFLTNNVDLLLQLGAALIVSELDVVVEGLTLCLMDKIRKELGIKDNHKVTMTKMTSLDNKLLELKVIEFPVVTNGVETKVKFDEKSEKYYIEEEM